MNTGTIGGFVFQDANRNGIFEAGETPMTNQHLYLYDGSGTYLTNTYTDANGWYQFTGKPDGTYTVKMASDSWTAIWNDWVPDNTGSVRPFLSVTLSGTARGDLGWRAVVRSTTPISSYVGSNGLSVYSYDDVIDAKSVYDDLMTGALVGPEAKYETVRIDHASTSSTTTSQASSNMVYTSYSATTNIAYVDWVSKGDYGLFHEYGHAWSLYYAYIQQQDAGLGAYLKARGLWGDSRLYSSYAWDPREMVAEDYRQLFGSANAESYPQANRDVPAAASVPGLKDFFAGAFMQPASGPVANTKAPGALSGSAQAGGTLSAINLGQWMGALPRSATYEWLRCDSSGVNCVTVGSGTYNGNFPTYGVSSADSGSTLRIRVSNSNSLGGDTALSPPTTVVP